MQLEKLAITLRPRNVWEATDLGVRIAVNWYKPLYKAWLAFTVPIIAAILAVAYFRGSVNSNTVFLIWWLIPLFDRMALFVISRVVFGEIPTLKQSIRHLPYLLTKTHLFRALTYGRLSPVRALHLPSDVLEGLKGGRARRRRKVLSRRDYFSTMVMTMSGVLIQYLFYIGALLLAGIMDFGVSQLSSTWFLHHFMNTTPLSIGIYLVVMLTFEPIYVAMGFSIYLKRRNELEAWDLELSLRKMDNQYQTKTDKKGYVLSSLLVACLFFLPSEPLFAADDYAKQRQETIEQAPERLKEVLAQPEFGTTVEQVRWKFIDKKDKTPELRRPKTSEHTVAKVGREVMWVLLAVIVLVIAYYVIRNIGVQKRKKSQAQVIPVEITGLDIRPDSLPDDINKAFGQLLQQKQYRAALSLLYRATLSILAHRDLVPFKDSDTEQDCLKRVNQHASQYDRFFTQLTNVWLLQAYANTTSDLTVLQRLNQDWTTHFDPLSNKERK